MPVRLGLERLLDGPDRKLITGQRIGLVCNPASIDSRIVHASDRLAAGDWTLAALFGPQHGFNSDLQENMIESPHAQDVKRRVPVHSLYSETREPTGEMLADIDVVPMDGWKRSMYFDDTGLPWVLPSPNIPTLDSAIVYPGGVLFEGTLLSEGRGTTRPFEIIGAPWIDGDRFAAEMNRRKLPGVCFRPVFFEPTFHKQAGRTCGGCQVHVTDRSTYRSMRVAVDMLEEFRKEAPGQAIWRDPPYEYETVKPPIDILYGSDRLRRAIDAGDSAASIVADWPKDEAAFRELRQKYLLY